MGNVREINFCDLYKGFNSPITKFDCGSRCAALSESGEPFCCDTGHSVPAAYHVEWEYLRSNTDLWHLWQPENENEYLRLNNKTPEGQTLIACKGHNLCQREFRSITCRAFPFFPYITIGKEFIGLSYFWEYEDRCWVISNLDAVSINYRQEFITAFEELFEKRPAELENFRYYSRLMRRVFGKLKRSIPLLHRNGNSYKITPKTSKMIKVSKDQFSKYGDYKIISEMPFPDELI